MGDGIRLTDWLDDLSDIDDDDIELTGVGKFRIPEKKPKPEEPKEEKPQSPPPSEPPKEPPEKPRREEPGGLPGGFYPLPPTKPPWADWPVKPSDEPFGPPLPGWEGPPREGEGIPIPIPPVEFDLIRIAQAVARVLGIGKKT